MITDEARAYGIAAASLRYFNVSGALNTSHGWLTERHDPETHLIANVLRSTATPGVHNIINLGSGRGYSVHEVLQTASDVLGRAVSSVDSPRRSGDPAVLIADITKARTTLQWEPTRDLKQMVSDTARSLEQKSS